MRIVVIVSRNIFVHKYCSPLSGDVAIIVIVLVNFVWVYMYAAFGRIDDAFHAWMVGIGMNVDGYVAYFLHGVNNGG